MKRKLIFVVTIVAILLLSGLFAVNNHYKDMKNKYLNLISVAYQDVDKIKINIDSANEKLSAKSETDTTGDLIQKLNEGTKVIKNNSEILSRAEIPEKERYAEVNKKLLECLQIEYNLLERIKDNLSMNDEYAAVESQKKTKELVTALKEQSSLLNIEENNFSEAFDITLQYEKIGAYLTSRAQLRYEKDDREQKERERIEAEERARLEREKNTFYVSYKIPYKNAPIFLSTNDMTVHVGQCIYLNIASDSISPSSLRWMMSDAPMHNEAVEMELIDGKLGAKFTAILPGKKEFTLVPDFSDWERSAKFAITVIP